MKRILFLLVALALVSSCGWAQINNGGSGGGGGTAQPVFLVAAPSGTDDTSAINAQLTACAGSSNGGTIILQAGLYKSPTCGFILSGNACTLQGQGVAGTVGGGTNIQCSSATANILQVGPNSGLGSTLRVRDLVVSRSVAGSGSSIGINVTQCNVCELTNLESLDSITGVSVAIQTTGNQLKIERVRSYATLGPTTNGFLVNGQTNSLRLVDVVTSGVGQTMTNAYHFASGAADVFGNRVEAAGTFNHGIIFDGNAEDIHIQTWVTDTCAVDCVNIANSSGGVFGIDNNITFDDGHWSTTAASTNAIVISSSQGITFNGGFATMLNSAKNAVQATSSSRLQFNNMHITIAGGTNTSICFSMVTVTDSIFNGNHCFGQSGTPLNAGYFIQTNSTRNIFSADTTAGTGNEGMVFDSTSSGNMLSGFSCNLATSTECIIDAQSAGNAITSSLLNPSNGTVGDAFSYKSTAAITIPSPVKLDTANANSVVITATTDTGAGIPIGVCANSPATGHSCLVMTHGTAPLTLGTGTCAIGNFVIVDTTTNGRVKCTSTYTAGTVIGTAQAAQSTVGNSFNVAIGLR